MNDIAELRQFVIVHARAQGIPEREYRGLLTAARTDTGDGPDSWAGVWLRAGERFEERGRYLAACRRYNMARFPYVDGPVRQEALRRCVAAFDRWRARTAIEPVWLDAGDGQVRCWSTGLSAADRRPLLLIMGGIVSIKEQWAPMLVQARRLGLAGLACEMPGVGENPGRYGADSSKLITRLLDCVSDRADVSRSYALAVSFSGNLALHAAAADPRVRGVITAGAPIGPFFTDAGWQRRLPKVTVDTLAHICQLPPADVHDHLRGLRLGSDQLAALDIPVYYLASKRDEIIPAADVEMMRVHVGDLRLRENDDVHASPRHVLESRLWAMRSLLELTGSHRPLRAALGAVLRGRGLVK